MLTPEEAYENLVDTLIDGHGFTLVGPYPQWISGDATPACSRCQNTMSLLLQIDSEEAADLIYKGLSASITDKKVTYDFERLMEGATLVKCSEFGDAMIAEM